MACAAIPNRSRGSSSIMMTKPRFSSPSSAVAGRRTSLKKSSAVSDVCWPILSIFFDFSKPAECASTKNSDVPLAPLPGSVIAATITRSAWMPLVIKIFEPFSTHSSPSRIALVRIPCTSDPAPGSVIAKAPTTSPLAIRGNQCAFCSSVP